MNSTKYARLAIEVLEDRLALDATSAGTLGIDAFATGLTGSAVHVGMLEGGRPGKAQRKAPVGAVLIFAIAAFAMPMLLDAGSRTRALSPPLVQEQPKKKLANAKEIPLASIYFTFPQKGTKHLIVPDLPEKYQLNAKELFRSAMDIGPSNIFMVYGDQIQDAVRHSWFALCGREPANKPVAGQLRPDSKNFWVVAYFGVNGSHGEWLIRSANIEGKRIRVSYFDGRMGGAILLDLIPYFAWIPLGKLEPGNYILELFDDDHKQLSLMRRVTVPDKK